VPRITTLNLNGIRSAFRKGLADWLTATRPDVICLQEIKIQDADLSGEMRHPDGYTGYFHHAEKKGYSGVGLYVRQPAATVTTGMGNPEFDAEGRVLSADRPGMTELSAYLQKSTRANKSHNAKKR
jgi:exodeoxyribonuclease-3